MKNKRIIIGSVVILMSIAGLFYIGTLFSPGSYTYTEDYELNADEKTLFDAVKKFKNDNPQYIVPDSSGLTDERRSKGDLWYHAYFYLRDNDQVFYTSIRADYYTGKTTFSLVSVRQGIGLVNWKDINNDFSWSDNRMYKRKFKERILNPITSLIK